MENERKSNSNIKNEKNKKGSEKRKAEIEIVKQYNSIKRK